MFKIMAYKQKFTKEERLAYKEKFAQDSVKKVYRKPYTKKNKEKTIFSETTQTPVATPVTVSLFKRIFKFLFG